MDKTQSVREGFDKNAQAYQDRFMDFELYNDTFDFFCEQVKSPHAEVLDIATGPGNISRYLLNQRPDFRLLGIDLSPRMVELAKINNPSSHFQVFDCRELSRLNRSFDGIICGFGLPYLSKEEALKLI